MYDQIREDTIYIILYTVVTVMAAMASIYLLFRRGNAFVAEITPPRRLRRWTAAFLAVCAVGHLWYLPAAVLTSDADIMLSMLIGALLDCMLTIPLALVVMLCMLQDRRRPLWPVSVMVAPLVVGMVVRIITRSEVLLPWLYGYSLLMAVGFTTYMVREVRRYGRWLRDNYADLEHKEVWQSFVVLVFILLVFSLYAFINEGTAYLYAIRVIYAVLICYLLWRVETLSDLSMPIKDAEEELQVSLHESSLTLRNDIGPLLKMYCEEPQLYLQHDLTLFQLAKAVGTNRFYLSQYFSSQGTTYYAYINGLRVDHFISLYRESVDDHRSFTAQQLAQESGFRNYNTFSSAFKRKTGQIVTVWMKAQERLR